MKKSVLVTSLLLAFALSGGAALVWHGLKTRGVDMYVHDTGKPVAPSDKAPAKSAGSTVGESGVARSAERRATPLPESPAFARFADLNEKALRTKQENEERANILSNASLLLEAKQILTARPEAQVDTERRAQRLRMISFLGSAIQDKESPTYETAIEFITESLVGGHGAFAPFDESTSKNVRKSLVGDKVELYALLRRSVPERAHALELKAKGTRLEAIIAFAHQEFGAKLTENAR